MKCYETTASVTPQNTHVFTDPVSAVTSDLHAVACNCKNLASTIGFVGSKQGDFCRLIHYAAIDPSRDILLSRRISRLNHLLDGDPLA